ncbi:MAG: hypothetical protein U0531_06230 [Dehalococcoidia bacterium]
MSRHTRIGILVIAGVVVTLGMNAVHGQEQTTIEARVAKLEADLAQLRAEHTALDARLTAMEHSTPGAPAGASSPAVAPATTPTSSLGPTGLVSTPSRMPLGSALVSRFAPQVIRIWDGRPEVGVRGVIELCADRYTGLVGTRSTLTGRVRTQDGEVREYVWEDTDPPERRCRQDFFVDAWQVEFMTTADRWQVDLTWIK